MCYYYNHLVRNPLFNIDRAHYLFKRSPITLKLIAITYMLSSYFNSTFENKNQNLGFFSFFTLSENQFQVNSIQLLDKHSIENEMFLGKRSNFIKIIENNTDKIMEIRIHFLVFAIIQKI